MHDHSPDQHFLRMVTDHHQGMREMAHAAMNRPEAPADVRSKAQEIDQKQHAELKHMTSMLEQEFGDRYEPKVMPDNERMIERVQRADGGTVDRTFYETVIEHHAQGLQMIDAHLPKLSHPKVRQMAEKMKTDQQQEIGELQGKIADR